MTEGPEFSVHEDESLSPPDAVVAARSMPRRFSAVLAPLDEADAATMLRPGAEGISAAGHAAQAASALEAAASDLDLLGRHDDPDLPEPPAAGEPASVEDALARVSAAAERLSTAATQSDAAFWTRSGSRAGASVRADQILRHAVFLAAHHLKLAQQVREQTRAR